MLFHKSTPKINDTIRMPSARLSTTRNKHAKRFRFHFFTFHAAIRYGNTLASGQKSVCAMAAVHHLQQAAAIVVGET